MMSAGASVNHARMWLTPALFLLSILAQVQPTRAQDPSPTTVSVFLPSYGPNDWAALRGSVISSNDTETTYTIFCAPESSSCNIGGGDLLPFTFAEGPSTYHYERTVESSITISTACLLAGTTGVTCSGTTSLGSLTLGPLSGPSSTSVAPHTLPESAVGWGVLTLAEPPLTSIEGSLTLTYYGSGTTGLVAPTGSQGGSASATGTPNAAPSAVSDDASCAGTLGGGWSGSDGGVAVCLLLAVLISTFL
ncbi:hypothetical protein F4804DRAFT_320703 [Jackrogersella minutella]|nr:hypothetical protein F4804DRAFT_320703 [Jackrogersella minutella]